MNKEIRDSSEELQKMLSDSYAGKIIIISEERAKRFAMLVNEGFVGDVKRLLEVIYSKSRSTTLEPLVKQQLSTSYDKLMTAISAIDEKKAKEIDDEIKIKKEIHPAKNNEPPETKWQAIKAALTLEAAQGFSAKQIKKATENLKPASTDDGLAFHFYNQPTPKQEKPQKHILTLQEIVAMHDKILREAKVSSDNIMNFITAVQAFRSDSTSSAQDMKTIHQMVDAVNKKVTDYRHTKSTSGTLPVNIIKHGKDYLKKQVLQEKTTQEKFAEVHTKLENLRQLTRPTSR
jgi:hypothetical protein